MTPADIDFMRLALQEAQHAAERGEVPVGAVLVRDGQVIGRGFNQPITSNDPSAHAEMVAIREAATALQNYRLPGTTLYVTLEPCNHTGRTGPCAQALIAAGVRRVVHAQRDPNPVAAGGAETLRAAGIEVVDGLLADDARALNRVWTFAVETGRPFVTWKFATTLDGRSAAADGTSRWVSGTAARRDTHRLRALADTMLVGANTVEVDDPQLTVRDAHDRPLPHQPLRAVMGLRDLAPDRRVLDDQAETVHLRTRDPHEALQALRERDRQHVFLEGGPTLAAAFLREDLVDEVVVYVAPFLLGAGQQAVADLGITTIADAWRPRVVDLTVLEPVVDGEEPNVRLTLVPPSPVEVRAQRATRPDPP